MLCVFSGTMFITQFIFLILIRSLNHINFFPSYIVHYDLQWFSFSYIHWHRFVFLMSYIHYASYVLCESLVIRQFMFFISNYSLIPQCFCWEYVHLTCYVFICGYSISTSYFYRPNV